MLLIFLALTSIQRLLFDDLRTPTVLEVNSNANTLRMRPSKLAFGLPSLRKDRTKSHESYRRKPKIIVQQKGRKRNEILLI